MHLFYSGTLDKLKNIDYTYYRKRKKEVLKMFEKDFNETVENINNFWADMFEMVGMKKEEKEEKNA